MIIDLSQKKNIDLFRIGIYKIQPVTFDYT